VHLFVFSEYIWREKRSGSVLVEGEGRIIRREASVCGETGTKSLDKPTGFH